jgi:hypothetical protein
MTVHSFMAALLLAAAVPLPRSASIVDVTGKLSGQPLGNVKVVFADGHAEIWARQGRALLPRVSGTGLVGWLYFEIRDAQGIPVDDRLTVFWPDGKRHQEFAADGAFPFIERWDFAAGDSAVVIKSRAEHGPADYREFDLATGKLIGHAHGLFDDDLPPWARPFSD